MDISIVFYCKRFDYSCFDNLCVCQVISYYLYRPIFCSQFTITSLFYFSICISIVVSIAPGTMVGLLSNV